MADIMSSKVHGRHFGRQRRPANCTGRNPPCRIVPSASTARLITPTVNCHLYAIVEAVTLIRVAEKPHVSKTESALQNRLGASIRRCRHQLGITQEELAWRADLHRTFVADIERGVRNVTLRTVANLATALHVTVGNLLSCAATPSETAPNEVREILLVEHNAASTAMTARAFKRARFANPLRIVRSGEIGLDYLFGSGRYAKRKPVPPQLILLVPDLPRMSSSEFLRRVKGDERTRDIPVVFLTVSR